MNQSNGNNSVKAKGSAYEAAGRIGIFDSGLGGLSVLKPLTRMAPNLHLDYYADSLYCPYATKDSDFIRKRALDISLELIAHGAEVVVVACNTASAAGLNWLRTRLTVPVVGMEPAVKPAAHATLTGRIGVLATSITLSADRFADLLERFTSGVKVFTEPAPELVELVESGRLEGQPVEKITGDKVAALMKHDVDVIVLGCTHFPFLASLIGRLAGPNVKIIETGSSVAAQTIRVHQALSDGHPRALNKPLQENPSTSTAAQTAGIRLWTSADVETILKNSSKLLPDLHLTPGRHAPPTHHKKKPTQPHKS